MTNPIIGRPKVQEHLQQIYDDICHEIYLVLEDHETLTDKKKQKFIKVLQRTISNFQYKNDLTPSGNLPAYDPPEPKPIPLPPLIPLIPTEVDSEDETFDAPLPGTGGANIRNLPQSLDDLINITFHNNYIQILNVLTIRLTNIIERGFVQDGIEGIVPNWTSDVQSMESKIKDVNKIIYNYAYNPIIPPPLPTQRDKDSYLFYNFQQWWTSMELFIKK